MEKVCILGGGASALFCACHIKNKDVTIFERADKIGKKILATGNGRCNLTNKYMNKNSYNQNLDNYFKRFNVDNTLKFFNSIGLEIYSDDEGRVYPILNTATSVVSVLKNYIKNNKNIKINTEKDVISVKMIKNKFKIEFLDNTFEIFDKVIVATGNYTDLKIYENMGIKCKPFIKSLCSLKTEKHKHLSGVRVDNVCVKCSDVDFCENGEVLFKDDGISGIVIFNLSSHLARKKINNVKISLDILPDVSYDKLIDILISRKNNLSNLLLEDYLTGFFHKQINYEILKRVNLDLQKSVKNLNNNHLKNIASIIKNFEFNVCGVFDNNQVCSGGIVLTELDENLQSRKYKGLYFVGEVVDVDGVCGGYNLQWAWTSGHIVGESV